MTTKKATKPALVKHIPVEVNGWRAFPTTPEKRKSHYIVSDSAGSQQLMLGSKPSVDDLKNIHDAIIRAQTIGVSLGMSQQHERIVGVLGLIKSTPENA